MVVKVSCKCDNQWRQLNKQVIKYSSKGKIDRAVCEHMGNLKYLQVKEEVVE